LGSGSVPRTKLCLQSYKPKLFRLATDDTFLWLTKASWGSDEFDIRWNSALCHSATCNSILTGSP
jgi:hypothetical protein